MTLSETDIETALGTDALRIDRDGELRIEPSSVDLHLEPTMLAPVPQADTVDVTDPQTYPAYADTHEIAEAGHDVYDDGMLIGPHDFLLATTEETVTLGPELVAILHGRSSVGRLGLFIENAGLIDAGFSGQITLELFNAAPYAIRLEPEMRIAQLTFHRHENAPAVPYSPQRGSKYNGQRGPTPSRLYEDFTNTPQSE